MIQKISFNKEFKQFGKGVTTPDDLKRYNLFYGMNGTGKSTLSRLFYRLEQHERSLDKFNEDKESNIENVEFTYNGQVIDWNNLEGFCQDNDVKVRVFNSDFIKRNIHDDDCNSIYVFGEDNNELKKEIKKLEENNGELKKGIDSLEKEMAEKEKPNFDFTVKAKTIRDDIPHSSMTDHKFNATHLEQHLKSLENFKYQKLNHEDYCSNYKLIKGENGEGVKTYSVLALSISNTNVNDVINDIIYKVKNILEKTVITETIERLENNNDNSLKDWVRKGYNEFSKQDENSPSKCPFCEQSLTREFWNKLSSVFTDEEKQLLSDIQKLQDDIAIAKSEFKNNIIDSQEVYPVLQIN